MQLKILSAPCIIKDGRYIGTAGGVKTWPAEGEEMTGMDRSEPHSLTGEREQTSILYQLSGIVQPFRYKVLRGHQNTFFM